MATRIRVQVKGVSVVLKNLRSLAIGAELRLEKAIGICTQKVMDDARGRAPVDTGLLRRRIRSRRPRRLRGYVIASARHAANVEFGTKEHRAQPFLLPAAEAARSQCEASIREAVGSAAREAE